MKAKKMLAAIMAASMILVTACGTKKDTTPNNTADKAIKDGGTIIFQAGGDPNVLNPLYGNDRVTMTINNALFSPLFVMNGDKTDFYLAESFEGSSDFLTYTLKFKKDLKWHDGKPLTSDDMIFTLDKILDKKENSLLRDYLVVNDKAIEYKKIDDTTIEFKLPEVTATFKSSVARLTPIPKHIFEGEENIAKSTKNDNPIGSGPYKYKEATKGESVTLVRNEDYFRGKPHLETVVYRIIPDANTANSALTTGEISAKYISAKDVDKFKDKLNVITFSENMLNNMVINQNNDALKIKEVRQAIAYALDKEELIKGAYTSTEYGDKANTVFTPGTLYHDNNGIEKYDFNIAKSKELLSKAGITSLNLKLAYTNGNKEQEAQSLIVQQRLKDVGINVELMGMERNAFIQKLVDAKNNKDFDLGFNGFVMGVDPDGYKPLFLTGNPNNFMNYSNKDLDTLWGKGAIETDNKKRDEIYKEIQKTIADDMSLYPIVFPKSIVAIDNKFGGVEEAEPAPIFMFRDLSKLYEK